MYISTDLLIKIVLITIAALHVLFDLILWFKLRKLKSDTTPDISSILTKARELGGKIMNIIEPAFPNIAGLIRAITGGEKPKEKDDNGDN